MKKPLLFICLHLGLYLALYCLLSFLGWIKGYPTNETVMHWDANWYDSIVKEGYVYHEGAQSNMAFFPLFPLLWKLSGLSPLSMSALNLAFMLAGMLLLWKTYRFDGNTLLLLLSVPSLFFCYLPYAEALFFLSGALIIYGLHRRHWLAVAGVFLSGLIRSVSLIFIPIILFAKLYQYEARKNNRKLFMETGSLILATIASQMVVQYLQFRQTGEFFAIFKVLKAWDRVLSLPHFYLTTWGGARLIWLDGLALLTGILAGIFCLRFLVEKLKNSKQKHHPALLFSLAYLTVVSITVLMYSGKEPQGNTSIISLNRYVFATPFFSVFLLELWKKNIAHKKSLLYFLLLSLTVWSLFGMFHGIWGLENFAIPPRLGSFLYFAIVTLYSGLYWLLSDPDHRTRLSPGLYMLNVMLQIFLFTTFLKGTWVG